MFSRINSISPENESPLGQPASNSNGKRRFGMKPFIAIAAVIVIIVVVAALMIPQGAASIPLTVNYNVGEKMVYDTTINVGFDFGNSSSLLSGLLNNSNITSTGQLSLQVLSFNDPYYTINQTISMNVDNVPFSYSNLETMDKTGCSTYLANFGGSSEGADATNPSSNYYLAQLLDRSEVKVGDSVSIPYPSLPANLSSAIRISGSITLTFKGFQNLNVPAGTYKVFRVDITSNDLSLTMNTTSLGALGSNLRMTANLNYQLYFEYGTMRLIKSAMQENAQLQSSALNYALGYGIDMTLSQDIQP